MGNITVHKSWENIFNTYGILKEIRKKGFFDISSEAIKAVDGKEPRLMTKIDFSEHLPNIMKEQKLSILAIKNGLYRIACNEPFVNINENIETPIIEINPPSNIVTIDPFNIKSESAVLDISTLAGIFNIVFNEHTILCIRGRLRGALNFTLGRIVYNVDGVQIEVDGGYEGNTSINLVEAKIGFRNNINIRQLLYPQLYWEKKINNKKKVKSYIFYLDKNIYRFIPYIYDGKIGYADHSCEKAFKFKEPSNHFDFLSIKINEDNICLKTPFPQADKFDTIHSMLLVILEYPCMTKYELKLNFDIVDRQIDYYYNVLKWLKFCKEENNCIVLTQKADKILKLPFKLRIIEMAKIVFSEPICNFILNNYYSYDSHYKYITSLFKRYNVDSFTTIKRRIQTIKSWISYFKNIIEN